VASALTMGTATMAAGATVAQMVASPQAADTSTAGQSMS
jgi:hypothetical protein